MSKYRTMILAAAAAALFCAGCLAPRTSGIDIQNGKLRVADAAFRSRFVLLKEATARTPEGFLRVSVSLENAGTRTYPCQYRFVWLDADGLELDAAKSQWTPLSLLGRQKSDLQRTSPTVDASGYRLEIRRR